MIDGFDGLTYVQLGPPKSHLGGFPQLICGDLRVVAGKAGESGEPVGIAAAKAGQPFVVDVVHQNRAIGVGDAVFVAPDRESAAQAQDAVNDLCLHAVQVLVLKAEMRGGGVELPLFPIGEELRASHFVEML